MGYGWDGWGWDGWWIMVLVMILVWGAVVLSVVALARHGRDRREPPPPPPPDRQRTPSALDVLDERFARGEIDADEYTKRRELLRAAR